MKSQEFDESLNQLMQQGNALFKDGQGAKVTEQATEYYNQAITCYDKAIVLHTHTYRQITKGHVTVNERIITIELQRTITGHDFACFDVFHMKGQTLAALTRYEDAIQCYGQAINLRTQEIERNKLVKENITVHFDKGVALDGLGRHAEAITCYAKVIQLFPNHVHAHFNNGMAHYHLEQYATAIKCYNEVIELQPANIDALDNKNHAQLCLQSLLNEALSLSRESGDDVPHGSFLGDQAPIIGDQNPAEHNCCIIY